MRRCKTMSMTLDEKSKKMYCEALAENLPVFRAKLGVSQEELANRIGLSRNMLACIETKKKEMSWITFVALALLFLKNEDTAPIFKSLNIYDEELDNFLMFEQSALWVLTDSKYVIMIIIGDSHKQGGTKNEW